MAEAPRAKQLDTPLDRPLDTPATTDALRHEIDSGRAGDKINFPDPAAAPLGTDDEAAGAAPRSATVRQAVAEETGRAAAGHGAPASEQGGAGWAPSGFLIALIVFVAVSIVAAMIVLR